MKKLIYKIMLINIIFVVMINCLSIHAIANTTQLVVTIKDTKNEKIQILEDVQVVNKKIMLPMEETFEKMGIEMKWNENRSKFSGSFNEIDIMIDKENKRCILDRVPMQLEEQVMQIEGKDMITLYFISKICGVEVIVDGKKGIQIDDDFNMHNVDIITKDISREADLDYLQENNLITSTPIIDNPIEKFNENDNEIYRCEIVSENNEKVLELETKKECENFDDVILSVNTTEEFPANNEQIIGVVSFLGRAITPINSYEKYGYVKMQLKNNKDDKKQVNATFALDSNWKRYYFPIESSWKNYPISSFFSIAIGGNIQIIQIKNLEVIKYNVENSNLNSEETMPSGLKLSDLNAQAIYKILDPTTESPYKDLEDFSEYKGMEEDALWREEALRRIEKYRKNDIKVTVKDKNGVVLDGANVDINMSENEFKIGTSVSKKFFEGVDSFSEEDKAKYINDYIEAYKNLKFNAIGASNAFKWNKAGNTLHRTKIEEFAKENELYLRGHCILWDGSVHLPQEDEFGQAMDWNNYSEEEIYKILEEHITDIISNNPTVKEWDVLNEPTNNQYLKEKLGDGYDFWAYLFTKTREETDKIDNDIKLYVNETGIKGGESGSAKRRVKNLINIINKIKDAAGDTENSLIDGVGIQNHVSGRPVYPQELYNQIDEILEKTGLSEAAITEYDYINDEQLKIYDNVQISEELKAKYLKDMLIIAYSHPKVKEFILWNLLENVYYENNNGSFYNKETQVYRELMKEWTTNESGKTDENGTYSIRGHKGTYTITAEYKGNTVSQNFTLSDDKKEIELVLDVEKEITLTSNKYTVENEYISNIGENTNVETLLNNLETNGTIEIYNHNNRKIEGQAVIGTGMKLRLSDGREYKLVVTGDLNGDGKVSITDLSKMKLHLIRKQVLENEYEKAVDMNKDGNYSITDLSKMKLYMLNK